MEVRDLWPESIKAVGALNDNLFIRYFEWQEKRCYRSAESIVVVTDSFKQKIEEKGITPDKIYVIKNGVDKDCFKPMPKDTQLIKDLHLEGKQIIGYIGTHGMAHKLDFILDCAKALDTNDNNYHFLFIGDGAQKAELELYCQKLGCQNVTMLDSVPKSEVKRYISILDVCLINLRKSQLFKTVIPSKIFENAGMEVPILMGVEGEAKDIIESYHAGVCYEPENQKDFIKKLSIILSPDKRPAFKTGCQSLADAYDRKKLASDMQKVIIDSLT
jgi:glycosyltransferase involved in cell wall biosynthesis